MHPSLDKEARRCEEKLALDNLGMEWTEVSALQHVRKWLCDDCLHRHRHA